MTPDELSARAALQALGALDGEERAAFEQALSENGPARRETEAFARVVDQLGLAAPPVTPSPGARTRLLDATRPAAPHRLSTPLTLLATAAALLFAFGFFVMRAERDEARRAAEVARGHALDARAALLAARESLARETAFRTLVSRPEARLVNLGPLAPAPLARARVVFDPTRREAVLIASGLEPAPAGKGYEVWVIGKAAPVAAGVFQVDAAGNAVHRLPALAEVALARTFAVTLEPAAGVGSPTGPMILAGAVS
jgi:anti-sigma-K factor RskA